MRAKAEAIIDFGPSNGRTNDKIVQQYRQDYKRINEILDQHPEILERVHRDLQKLSKATTRRGRNATLTSENLFRAVLVKQLEGLGYREASVRIAESETLQSFCRLLKRSTINYSLINRAFCAIEPETWEAINHQLGLQAVEQGEVTTDHVRTDTTVTECNIHWPTDSSLLWDTYRVIAREMTRARPLARLACPWRFHPRKIKKLHLFITRYAGSSSKKRKGQVRAASKTLIERVEKTLENVASFVEYAKQSGDLNLMAAVELLDSYLPVMRQVTSVARRRTFDGEKVPNNEKVFSIFEPHTELIKRGRRGKPIEFGHKILLTQSREKFITDYVVLEENRCDDQLLGEVIQRHKDRYGRAPESIAADMGFRPDEETFEELEEEVDYLSVPRRTRDFGDVMMGIWQQWRAGIEGTISCLKRAFRLSRCFFKGFRNFGSGIGSAIFCHNLRILARTSSG